VGYCRNRPLFRGLRVWGRNGKICRLIIDYHVAYLTLNATTGINLTQAATGVDACFSARSPMSGSLNIWP
jgi:hypothetical protein